MPITYQYARKICLFHTFSLIVIYIYIKGNISKNTFLRRNFMQLGAQFLINHYFCRIKSIHSFGSPLFLWNTWPNMSYEQLPRMTVLQIKMTAEEEPLAQPSPREERFRVLMEKWRLRLISMARRAWRQCAIVKLGNSYSHLLCTDNNFNQKHPSENL